MKNFREKWKLLKIQLTQHQPCFFIKLVTNSLDFINSYNNFDKIMLNSKCNTIIQLVQNFFGKIQILKNIKVKTPLPW